MNSIHTEALRESACETLENLAFTELAPDPAAELPEASARMGARIGLGPDGTLDLYLTRPLLGEIASILFNIDEEGLDAGVLSDTLLEIANIIAGRFLEKLHGAKSDFDLGLPALCDKGADWKALPVRMALTAGPGGVLAVGLAPAVSPG